MFRVLSLLAVALSATASAAPAAAASLPPVPFYFDGSRDADGNPSVYYDVTDAAVLPVADQVLLSAAGGRMNSDYSRQFAITNAYIDPVADPAAGWTGSSLGRIGDIPFEALPGRDDRYFTMVFDQNEAGTARRVFLERIEIRIDDTVLWSLAGAAIDAARPIILNAATCPDAADPLNDCGSARYTLTSNRAGADVALQISARYLATAAARAGITLTGASQFRFYWEDGDTPANGNAEQWVRLGSGVPCDESGSTYFCYGDATRIEMRITPVPPALATMLAVPAVFAAARARRRRGVPR